MMSTNTNINMKPVVAMPGVTPCFASYHLIRELTDGRDEKGAQDPSKIP